MTGTSQELAGAASPIFAKDGSYSDHASCRDDAEKQSIHNRNESNVATDKSLSKDPNIVDWDGPNDPENPLNWSSAKKITAIGLVSLVTLLSYVIRS